MVSSSLAEYGFSVNELALLSESRPRDSFTSLPSPSVKSEVTAHDHVALQFNWQGREVYVHSHVGDGVAPCFYEGDCGCSDQNGSGAEFVRILPVNEVRGLSTKKVQILSVNTGRYLRWADSRDEQTMFQIEMLYRSKSLTTEVQFKLESIARPGYYIGFTQTSPLGSGARTDKAMGFLTLEKKKYHHEGSLVFPLRLRVIRRSERLSRGSNAFNSPVCSSIPLVASNQVVFFDETETHAMGELPMALLFSFRDEEHVENTTALKCSYCHRHVRSQAAMVEHLRSQHGEWLQRESIPGSYCTCCGRRKIDDACPRCTR